MNKMPYKITQIAKVLLEEIEKHYPGLTTKYKFDSCGKISTDGSCAQERAEMCLYIELLKSGVFND